MFGFFSGIFVLLVVSVILVFIGGIFLDEELIFLPLAVFHMIVVAMFFHSLFSKTTYVGSSYLIEKEIYSLDSSIGLDGEFVLGSGSINSSPTYYVKVRSPLGGYLIDDFDATKTRIVSLKTRTPRVEYLYKETSLFRENILVGWFFKLPTYEFVEDVALYVPSEYIQVEFNETSQ